MIDANGVDTSDTQTRVALRSATFRIDSSAVSMSRGAYFTTESRSLISRKILNSDWRTRFKPCQCWCETASSNRKIIGILSDTEQVLASLDLGRRNYALVSIEAFTAAL
jgi:hypothetical protein